MLRAIVDSNRYAPPLIAPPGPVARFSPRNDWRTLTPPQPPRLIAPPSPPALLPVTRLCAIVAPPSGPAQSTCVKSTAPPSPAARFPFSFVPLTWRSSSLRSAPPFPSATLLTRLLLWIAMIWTSAWLTVDSP